MLLLVVISGCVKDKYEPVYTNTRCDTTYYTREIYPIIEANCAVSGCHDGHQATPNYKSYLELKTVIEEETNGESELIRRLELPLSDPKHMPVGGSIGHDEQDKIEKWIEDGYIGC